MSDKKQFDRSKCFTFFESYYTTGQMIEEMKGKEVAYEYYKAIIEYALYEKPIEDKEIFLYAGGDTALRMIDSSQERRSRGFGENPEVTKAIIEFVRDNPGMSQEKISKEVHCSKGKVNKTLKNFREGKYKETFDFNIIINNVEYRPDGHAVTDVTESEYEDIPEENNNDGHSSTYIYTDIDNDNDNDNDSTDRYRDRFASAQVAGSLNRVAGAPDASLDMVANAPDYSADAARLRLPVASEWPAEWIEKDIRKLDLRFDGRISNNEMPGIIARTYRQHVNDDELDNEEIFIEMVKEFTGDIYNCNKDEVKKVCAYICGVSETTFVPRVDPKPDDLSSDTDTVDSGSDSPDLVDSGLTDTSSDMVSTDITDSDSVTDSASDSSADLAPSDITVPSDTKDSSTVVPINQDNTDISGSNPGDAA